MNWVAMTTQLLFLTYLLLKSCQALECENGDTSEYCVSPGYFKDKLPPNPPLNVSISLWFYVRFYILMYRRDLKSEI